MTVSLEGRHPATVGIFRYFAFTPQSADRKLAIQIIRTDCEDLAARMIGDLPDGPELTTGLRKLLEAKDCFVRAALDLTPNPEPPHD